MELAALILLGVVVLGAAITWLGLRGRRFNDHPVCRRCRFDLLGVYPGGAKCPECGAGLQRKRAVRDGERRRRRVLVVIGVALLASPALLIVLGGVLLSTGERLQAYKPAALLAMEGRFRGKESSKSAVKELSRRLQGQESISEWEAGIVARSVVAMQRDAENEWLPEWGVLVEGLFEAGLIDRSAFLDYLRAGCRFEAGVRPRVWCEGLVPVSLADQETRWSQRGCNAVIRVRDLKIDGISVSRQEGPNIYPPGDLRPSASLVFYWATNSRRATAMGPRDQRVMLLPDPPLSPGRHNVTIQLEARYTAGSPMRPLDEVETINVERQIEAMADVNDVVRPIAPSEQTTGELRRALDPVGVAVQELSWAPAAERKIFRAMFTFASDALPAPISFDVVVVSGDQKYTIGGLIGRPGQAFRTDVNGAFEHAEGERVRVVLRPNHAHARRTMDMTEMYNGEVELTVDSMRGRRQEEAAAP